MALIVEDGSVVAGAESYATVAEANSYHSNRGNDTFATLTDIETEEALRRATDYMQNTYGLLWKGYRASSNQSLDFPREGVSRDDLATLTYYPNNEVPLGVKNACIELSFKAARGELTPDLTQRVKREKVDVLEVEYDEKSGQLPRYPMIDTMLSKFLASSVNSSFRRVVRT